MDYLAAAVVMLLAIYLVVRTTMTGGEKQEPMKSPSDPHPCLDYPACMRAGIFTCAVCGEWVCMVHNKGTAEHPFCEDCLHCPISEGA